MGMYRYFTKNVTFNEPFVLFTLNISNHYIFKCESASKVENGGEYLDFFYELGPFLVFITCFTEKISKLQIVTSKFSAFLGVKRNGRYIFQLFRSI